MSSWFFGLTLNIISSLYNGVYSLKCYQESLGRVLLPGVSVVKLGASVSPEVIFTKLWTIVAHTLASLSQTPAHLTFLDLVVEPLMNTEEFAISCGQRHCLQEAGEAHWVMYPFSLKSLFNPAVMVEDSQWDLVHLMLCVLVTCCLLSRSKQGKSANTPLLTFLFWLWLDLLPMFVKHKPPTTLGYIWGVF